MSLPLGSGQRSAEVNSSLGALETGRFNEGALLAQAVASAGAVGDNLHFRRLMDALPAAVYVTDAAGRLTYYNDAAARLWGQRPALGISDWCCGAWKIYSPNGTLLSHDQCPMAIALQEKRPIYGIEVVSERPDGTKVPFMPYPTPLFDESGALTGAINLLVEITGRPIAEQATERLAAIVEFSDDAILTKNLDGIITSWNKGAERIFGYTAAETIGRPVTLLIPAHLQDEEPQILARIRAGERVDHFETVRQRKDGSLVDISLTVSPLKNAQGVIVGASKIARDITERRRAHEQQRLLLREMDHRIKNLFSLASGVVNLSARSASTPQELAAAVRDRLAALARAHVLTLAKPDDDSPGERPATLHALIKTIASPYEDETGKRMRVHGVDAALSPASITSLALLLHEFATNAAKYGALSTPSGSIDVDCRADGDHLTLTWTERGGPRVDRKDDGEGFGSLLARTAVKGQLGGTIARDWNPEGLTIQLSIARSRL
jgi:PAS domain S-box-containing protein